MRKRTCPNLQIREKSFERNELFFLFVRVSIESKTQKKEKSDFRGFTDQSRFGELGHGRICADVASWKRGIIFPRGLMPRERLLYERHKSRPCTWVWVGGTARTTTVHHKFDTCSLWPSHHGRRVFLAIGGPRGFFIPRNHSTSFQKFQIASRMSLEKPVYKPFIPIIFQLFFPRPRQILLFVFSIARSWVLIFTCWSFSYFHFHDVVGFFFLDRSCEGISCFG